MCIFYYLVEVSTGPGLTWRGRAERFYSSLEIRAGFLQSFTRTIKLAVIVHSCIVLPNFTHRKSETYCTRTLYVNSVVSLMLCFSIYVIGDITVTTVQYSRVKQNPNKTRLLTDNLCESDDKFTIQRRLHN